MTDKWECKQCGTCCKFIVIPVAEKISGETLEYLAAHGIAVDGNRLVIPARCEYLTPKNNCAIHKAKFKNCAAGGERECKEAQRQYESISC
jgi:Fe-S-cluster containining protein